MITGLNGVYHHTNGVTTGDYGGCIGQLPRRSPTPLSGPLFDYCGNVLEAAQAGRQGA